MESPLVNNYKKPFILRRLLETFLGGLRLFASEDVPMYIYLMQVTLFSVIPILSILFVILEHNGSMTLNWAVYTCALLEFVYAFLLQIVAHLLRMQKTKAEEVEQVNFASDEEILQFDSALGPKTWSFLIREKRVKINILLHSLVVGVVGGGSIYYIRPVTTIHINVPWGVSLAFTILGFVTVSVGLWPLIGGAPPEPATFHPLPWDLAALSRPTHMALCIGVHFLSCQFPDVLWLLMVDAFFHLVFAASSILWLLGILPPIDALILWFLEQWLVIALGGSPMASNSRLVVQTVLGTLILCMVAAMPSFEALMVFASCFGFLLSIDYAWMLSSLLSHRVKMLTGMSGKYEETRPIAGKTSLRRVTCRRELVLYVSLFVAVVGMSLGCQIPHIGWYEAALNATEMSARNASSDALEDLENLPILFQGTARDAVGTLVILVALSVLVINELQKVYFLGVIRNPLFVYHKAMQKSSMLYTISQLLQIGGPLISLLLVHQVVSARVHQQLSVPFQSVLYFVLTIPVLRICRHIWQFPQPALLQLSLFYLLELIHRGTSGAFRETWGNLSPATRIFCVGLIYLWGTRLVQRICTVAVFLMASLSERKQHASLSFFLIGFNIAIVPILLSLMVLSSVVAAPLLPLFTLPIFFLGFPRPLRFWSYPVGRSSNSCDDSVYYEQLTPHVICALHNLVQTGSLGVVEPGEHFLLRWEDRFLWIQVLECGFTYFYYSVKGLELQETSCHTAEASRVDAVFSVAFDGIDKPKSGVFDSCLNPYAFHTLTPLSQISVVGFSDTKNVLTGVIDSHDTLKVTNDYFHKALIYVMMDYIVKRSQRLSADNPKPKSDLPTRSGSKLKNQDILKRLPKVDRRAEQHFEEDIPRVSIEERKDFDKVSSVGSHVSHSSHQTQSGRGSRLAWVDDQRLNEPTNVLPAVESRPSSWDDDEDPLDSSAKLKNGFSTLNNEEKVNMKIKDHKKALPPIRTKGNNYATSLEELNEAEDQLNFIPGIMYDDSSSDSNSESLASIHKVKFFRPKRKSSAPVNVRVLSRMERHTPIYNSPLSAALAPSPGWFLELPYDTEVIDEVQDTFPHAWFKFLLSSFGRTYVELQQNHSAKTSKSSGTSKRSGLSTSKSGGEKEDHIQKMQYDEDLEESYRVMVGTCHLIVLGSEITPPVPSQVYKTFCGEVPWSMALDWLLNKEDLYNLVIKAYRMGVKLSLDHTLIGTLTGWAELQACMEDYSKNWFFGPDGRAPDTIQASSHPTSVIDIPKEPKSWIEAVRMEIPNLFSMGYNPVKGVYTSHLLTLGEAEVSIGRLGSETVRGLWASLVMELLYLTNDDDERYSIQAQPGLLRNLTIQAADPPLGYPIFSSPPLRLAVPWLSATLQQLSSAVKKDRAGDIS